MNDYQLVFVDREMYDWLMNLYETSRVTRAAIDVAADPHNPGLKPPLPLTRV